MFYCGLCNTLSISGEKAFRVVTIKESIRHIEKGNMGTRIVKEVLAHERCVPAEQRPKPASFYTKVVRFMKKTGLFEK